MSDAGGSISRSIDIMMHRFLQGINPSLNANEPHPSLGGCSASIDSSLDLCPRSDIFLSAISPHHHARHASLFFIPRPTDPSFCLYSVSPNPIPHHLLISTYALVRGRAPASQCIAGPPASGASPPRLVSLWQSCSVAFRGWWVSRGARMPVLVS